MHHQPRACKTSLTLKIIIYVSNKTTTTTTTTAMGKNKRSSRHKNQDEEVDHDGGNGGENNDGNNTDINLKDLDFAQRREVQRQQAAEKRRAKQKCYLCGKAGHVRRQCPGIQDDGRGMSRYKGVSNKKKEKEKYQARKNSGKIEDTPSVAAMANKLEYPDLENVCYFDICCDISDTLNYLKQGRGKAKISSKEASLELQQALEYASSHTNFGGMISKTYLKPNRPWILPSSGAPFKDKTWYSVGLSRDFLCNDTEIDAATTALVETVDQSKDLIVGYWTILDYSTDFVKRPGCSRESQLLRTKATITAAARTGLSVQLQVLPGAVGVDPEESVAGTEYAEVLLDLQKILSEMFSLFPSHLSIILSNWTGLARHMMTFLNGFSSSAVAATTTTTPSSPQQNDSSNNLYIGLDGSVSFRKATNMHECAFEIPLDRLVVETSSVIPSEVGNALGRDAFYHSGLWPFVTKSIAHYKKTVTVAEVSRASLENTLKLYPQLANAAAAAAATAQNVPRQEDVEETGTIEEAKESPKNDKG